MPTPGSKGCSPDDVLSDAELKALCQRAIVRSFAKNTVVVSEGDRTDSLYIVVSGRVKIYVSDDQGKEMILNQAGAGEYFGEMVLDAGPRSASVMTLEPTRFLVVPKEDFAAFLAKSPEFALHLIRKLIRRVRGLTHDIKSLALMTLSLARALGPEVRLNVVAPGFVRTPWQIAAHGADGAAELERRFAERAPLKAAAEAQDAAEAIAWLIESARRITGQIVYVDGGMHIAVPR